MYECCNVRRFFKLLVIDAVIFGLTAVFFLIGKCIFFSAAEEHEEEGVFLPAIMYHSVHDGEPTDYSVTPQQLDNDLAYLSEHGYTAVSAQQLCDYTDNRCDLPEKPVLLTFDDGFYNNLCNVLPLLEKYDMRAVVSVVGSYIDNNAAADPHVADYSYLTWEDVNALLDSGRVEIGNHTYNMHFLSPRNGCAIMEGEDCQEYSEILSSDISRLQSEMLENTGTLPVIFAYPFGSLCGESLPVLRECGFIMTLTCRERMNYITRSPDCLRGIDRFNRSGLVPTEEFMERVLDE